MGVYIFNLISILFYSSFMELSKLIRLKKNNKIINLLLNLIVIQLFFISAFRSVNVGIDLQRYIPRYNLIADTKWSNIFGLRNVVDFEYGYIIYNKIISVIFNNEQALIIITSLIVVFSFSLFIRNYSKIPWLSFYLFVTMGYFGGSFNILRQYLAMSIILFSLKYIIERDFLKFLICLIFAVSIHKTAAIFIVLYSLYKIRINSIYIILLSFFAIIIGFTSKYIIKFVLSGTSYSKFLGEIGSGLGKGSGEGMLIVLLLVFLGMLFFNKNLKKLDPNTNLWFHMIIVAIFFNILALNLGVFERVMRFFTIAMIIVIPNILYFIKQKEMKLIGIVAVILLSSYYYLGIVMTSYSSSGGIIPYTFMWQ